MNDNESNLFNEQNKVHELDNSLYKLEKNDFTVVIPVLNEEDGIGQVIKRTKEEGYHNILVIDGYSADNTVEIAIGNDVNVIYQHGIGKTGAIKTAIEHIKTPYFVVMDGDCTYDPKDIKNFFPHILSNEEVIGCRTFGRDNISVLNRFGNWVINFVFNLFFGTNLIDVCTGLYALNTRFAKTLNLKTQGFEVEVEIAAQAATEGDVTQVPINYYPRVGQQKLKPFRHGTKILQSIWTLARLYNPVFLFSILAALNIIPASFILIWVAMEWYKGVWHSGLALLGATLLIIATLALTLSTISTLLKRQEQRIIKKLKYQI